MHLVFVHGVNEHLPVREEMRRWRKALKTGSVDPDRLGLRSSFGYYADWFFEGSNEPDIDFGSEALSPSVIAIERALRGLESELPLSAREAIGGLDITTFIPQWVVQTFLKRMFRQLFLYFDNTTVTHPTNGDTRGARDVVREGVLKGIKEARRTAGDNAKVVVLAHELCPKVGDALIRRLLKFA